MKPVAMLFAWALLAAAAAADNAPPENKPEDSVMLLEPLLVKGKPISSFAFDIRIYATRDTKKVSRMFITRVLEDTDAQKLGLQAGDEIIRLDGVDVKELEARVAPDSRLGAMLLNRQTGEALKIEVITHRTAKFTLRARRPMPSILP